MTYLGIDAITCKAELAINGEGNGARKSYSIFWQALINDILNPKIVMFFFAFLPQFVDARGSHPTLQLYCQDAQMTKTGVGVEKLQFPPKQPKFGGYKMSRKSKKSFVGHRRAILFLRISDEGVFQRPQAIALRTLAMPLRDMRVMFGRHSGQ